MHCRQAGESLSKHNHLFSLDGLTEPFDTAAESVSKYEGDYLDIDFASSPSSAACNLVVAGKDYVYSCPCHTGSASESSFGCCVRPTRTT